MRDYFLKAGWIRAAWMTALFWGIGLGIVLVFRWWAGWEPLFNWTVITVVATLTAAPIGFLAGLGCFDYWTRYALGAPTVPEDHSSHGGKTWQDYFRPNTDHKVIGVQYLVTTIVFFVIGGMLAMLFRAELARPGMQFVDNQTFNGLVSVHAALMIFLFVIPAFAGLGNYVIPLMIGAPDMAFPRLNALSYWLLPIAGVMMVCSFFCPGGAFATGWTSYAPLASDQPFGQVFFNMGVQWAGASSIMTALNFLVTIITMRAPGMTFWRMPLLVWANFTTSLLVVIATPFIAGSQFFVMFDRVMHTNFFDPSQGGYVLGYQHIFWFYSHPAVYIMMLPGFGIASEVISTMARKPIFGYRLMALSLMAILVLGFSVWAHHMFVAGVAPWLRIPMMVTSMIIAVPTGIKVFSWLATIWEGKLHFTTPMLFALGFVSMFVIGGLSGIYLAAVPIDIHVSDTYFVVAHIHYVLFGGSLFTIFAGIYYWFPKMTGRMYNERLGKLHFWLTFIGFNVTFFPMHYIGTQGMPRRVSDYAPRFADWNMVISISSFFLGASTIVFLYNMITSWVRGPKAESNPWRAHDARVAGLLAAAATSTSTSSRRSSATPYEYGVPGARHAVFNGDRAGRARGGASETVDATCSWSRTRRSRGRALTRGGQATRGADQVTVVCPVNAPREGYVVYQDTRRAAAGRRLDRTLEQLRAARDLGGRLRRRDRPGGRGARRARAARAAGGRDHRLDAPGVALRLDAKHVVERIEKAAGAVPVEHVVVDLKEEGGEANVLVIANETVVGRGAARRRSGARGARRRRRS